MTLNALATLPSTDLAQAPRGLMASDDLRQQIVAVQRLREAVRMSPLAEAVDIAERARMAARWAKVAKSANELAVEAVKLECQALRRVGQLDSSVFKGERKNVAEAFAKMTDEEFAVQVLVRAVSGCVSAAAVLRTIRAEDRHERDVAEFWSNPTSHRLSYREVHDAATTLLVGLDTETSTSEIVAELAESLGLDDLSGALNAGLRAIVNHAIANVDSEWRSLREIQLPEFATIRSDVYPEFKWRRVPMSLATLPQLRAMAADRRRQAEELAARADALDAAVTQLDELAQRFQMTEPEPGQIGKIVNRALRMQVLHSERAA